MGHHSIKVIVDIYGHLAPGGNKEAVDKLDDSPSSLAKIRNDQLFVDWFLRRFYLKGGITTIYGSMVSNDRV